MFKDALKRGIKVRINTNSLAFTDKLEAFSGYRNQRDQLIKIGIEVYEYKPDPQIKQKVVQRVSSRDAKRPVFAIHAKTMVVVAKTVFIGTFNFDPRSQNLNAEVGVIVQNEALASNVQSAVEADMQPENGLSAATDNLDQYATGAKRRKVAALQLTPIKLLL